MSEIRPFHEMSLANGDVRDAYRGLSLWLDGLSPAVLESKCQDSDRIRAERDFSAAERPDLDGQGRPFALDPVPRIFTADEWDFLSRGVVQRVRALNLFLADIYHDAEIVRSGFLPADLVFGSPGYQVQMHGFDVPGGVYAALAAIDLVRVSETRFLVIKDNLHAPSGIARMMENRSITEQLFPGLISDNAVVPLQDCGQRLLQTVRSLSPTGGLRGRVVQLSNRDSGEGYFEDAWLASSQGIERVEAQDLRIWGGQVQVRTTGGIGTVDIIRHSIDGTLLDPLILNPQSDQGVAGLVSVYRSGGVAVVNAIGTAVAGDPFIGPLVGDMIRHYLGEEPVLEYWQACQAEENTVSAVDQDRFRKHGMGTCGIADGAYPGLLASRSRELPSSLPESVADAEPDASTEPVLSHCPGWTGAEIGQRPVVLRMFVLAGEHAEVLPGALTNVVAGPSIANAEDIIGMKDTWVLEG